MKTAFLLLYLAIGCLAPAMAHGDTELSPPERRHHMLLTGTLWQAKSVELFYGTPQRFGKKERPSERVVVLDEFEFFADSRALSTEVAKKITDLVSNPLSHSSYGGLKLCGGFHPDYCVVWRFEKDDQRWEIKLFICMSCHEWRMIDTLSALHDDISVAGYAAIKGLFPPR